MDLGIAGRVAIVTGATRGIGKAAAGLLSAEGVRLALFARTAESLEQAAAEIRGRSGNDVIAIAGDMCKPQDVARMVDMVQQRFGTPEILILVTGRPPRPREVLQETELPAKEGTIKHCRSATA